MSARLPACVCSRLRKATILYARGNYALAPACMATRLHACAVVRSILDLGTETEKKQDSGKIAGLLNHRINATKYYGTPLPRHFCETQREFMLQHFRSLHCGPAALLRVGPPCISYINARKSQPSCLHQPGLAQTTLLLAATPERRYQVRCYGQHW